MCMTSAITQAGRLAKYKASSAARCNNSNSPWTALQRVVEVTPTVNSVRGIYSVVCANEKAMGYFKPTRGHLKALVHERQHDVGCQVGHLAQAEACHAHQIVVLPHIHAHRKFCG